MSGYMVDRRPNSQGATRAVSSELALLQWYLEAGVDEAIADTPWNRKAPAAQVASVEQVVPAARAAFVPNNIATRPEPAQRHAPPPPPPMHAPAAPSLPGLDALEKELAAIDTLEALRARLDTYDGCALKTTAMNTVFGAGPADADLMIIGEAPGEEEDRRGMPFVGPSGQLLNKMLAAIGVERDQVYVTNTLYWRPPGNRTPTPQEIMACAPFRERQISIIAPKVLLLVGGAAAKTVLKRTEGIMRLRGKWAEVQPAENAAPIPAMATLHPTYLLRSPAQKREAWHDLLAVSERLLAE
jgi:uracil-DNA glycosylase family 4